MLRGAARLHQQLFERMIDDAGTVLVVRQPAAATEADVAQDKVLGKRAAVSPTAAVGETSEVIGLWSTGYATPTFGSPPMPAAIAALGRTDSLDAVFRCVLADVLLDQQVLHGRTLFDTALDVQFGGVTWRVVATDRSGLAPSTPYICWVALKKIGGP